MRVLVTGGAGFIGLHVVRRLLAEGVAVAVLDDLSNSTGAGLPSSVAHTRGCVTDAEACARAAAGCDAVLHLAARGAVPRSLDDPSGSVTVNTVGTLRVLEAARAVGARRVVLASSSTVYGDQPGFPRDEALAPDPRSPYAASKVAAEALTRAWHGGFGLETVMLRLFNVYGPGQRFDVSYPAVVPRFVAAALAGRAAELHGGGGQGRDFTYVEDVAGAFVAALRSERVGGGEAINVAAGRPVTVAAVHGAVARLTGCDVAPRVVPARAVDMRLTHAAVTRARDLLGWSAEVGLEAGLVQTLAWARAAFAEQTQPAAE